jgi:RNA polymerase sigma factor (sigma-70 family)
MSSSQASEVIEHLRRAVLMSDGAGLTDGQLLDDFIRRHDQSALAALVRRHGPMVWGVCRRVLSNPADAEDAFQVTFLVLVRKAACVKPREMVANWLYGVAHQTALKARATAAKRKTRERQVTEVPEPSTTAPDLWEDLQPLLDEELSRLPDKCRVAIVLCDLEGKSYKEAARQLGVPDGTLSARLTRGRAMLAKRLARRGLAVSGASLATVLASSAVSASVPASLVSYTIKVAGAFAAGEAVAGAISAHVAALTEGVLKTMLLSKIRTAAAIVLMLIAFVGGGLGFLPNVAGQHDTAKKAEAPAGRREVAAPGRPAEPMFPDLTKIDRTIHKEPRYAHQPYYALLAIGPEAKKRVWLVVDGEVVYVDRNGNGDLTEAKKRVAVDKTIKVAPGMYKHFDSFDLGKVEGLRLRLDFWVRDKKFVPDSDFDESVRKGHEENGWEFATLHRVKPDGSNVEAQIPVAFCRRPQDAPICHLAGPLTFVPRMDQRPTFFHGTDENMLSLLIGTPGLPARNWKNPVTAPLATTEVPADVHPVAHFMFPHKDGKSPPIEKDYVLRERCCGDCFYGHVQVPADAAKGKARVTVSYPAWKDGKVIPATFEVYIAAARSAAEKEEEIERRRRSQVEQLLREAGVKRLRAGHHTPDRLPLGTVRVGATIEASFIVYEKGDDPKKVALSVETPAFVKVLETSVIERGELFDGSKMVKAVGGIVVIRIDTTKPADFQGEVNVKLGNATTRVPVSVTVKPADRAAVKILVVDTPFDRYSTDDAGVFKTWTDLTAQAGWDVSYLALLRGKSVLRDIDLSKFRVILLGGDGLLSATADDVKRVRAFVEGGGRLVVAASRFLSGSIAAANKFLDGYGLQMADVEAPSEKQEAILDRKAFAPEVLNGGIHSARFYRASPISVTAGKPARVLVKSAGVGGPRDGFVAAAKARKGEVVALGESLWWNWINAGQPKGIDNAKLFQMLLTPAEKKN